MQTFKTLIEPLMIESKNSTNSPEKSKIFYEKKKNPRKKMYVTYTNAFHTQNINQPHPK